MEVVPFEFCNPCVVVLHDLHGKVEQVHLADNNFTNGDLFPYMKIEVYLDHIPLESSKIEII